jgi:hypothetical protein
MRKTTMIAESFDARTLANMEVALERACKVLPTGSEEHPARRHIARKILERAKRGDKTLGALTEAGRAAARSVRHRGLTSSRRGEPSQPAATVAR